MTSAPDRPDISHYPTVEGRWNPAKDDSLTVAFYGTSSMLIKAGQASLLIDGFFRDPRLRNYSVARSRPSRRSSMPASPRPASSRSTVSSWCTHTTTMDSTPR